jgi:hypothetical protein
LQPHFFYLCVLQLFFLLQSQSHVFFATVLFLQLHYAKGAITPRKGCNHSHAWFSNCFFLQS